MLVSLAHNTNMGSNLIQKKNRTKEKLIHAHTHTSIYHITISLFLFLNWKKGSFAFLLTVHFSPAFYLLTFFCEYWKFNFVFGWSLLVFPSVVRFLSKNFLFTNERADYFCHHLIARKCGALYTRTSYVFFHRFHFAEISFCVVYIRMALHFAGCEQVTKAHRHYGGGGVHSGVDYFCDESIDIINSQNIAPTLPPPPFMAPVDPLLPFILLMMAHGTYIVFWIQRCRWEE